MWQHCFRCRLADSLKWTSHKSSRKARARSKLHEALLCRANPTHMHSSSPPISLSSKVISGLNGLYPMKVISTVVSLCHQTRYFYDRLLWAKYTFVKFEKCTSKRNEFFAFVKLPLQRQKGVHLQNVKRAIRCFSVLCDFLKSLLPTPKCWTPIGKLNGY